jgi:hypothetical protein
MEKDGERVATSKPSMRRRSSVIRQVDSRRKQLEQAEKSRVQGSRNVLHPQKYRKFFGAWDVISTSALLYTATLTPFETAFINSDSQ